MELISRLPSQSGIGAPRIAARPAIALMEDWGKIIGGASVLTKVTKARMALAPGSKAKMCTELERRVSARTAVLAIIATKAFPTGALKFVFPTDGKATIIGSLT